MATEILGLTEILGYDDDEDDVEGDEAQLLLGEDVVGARRRAAKRGAARQRQLPASVRNRGVAVEQHAPTQGRELVLGFDSGAGTILAAATAAINSNPQQVFRPERICVQGTAAPNFLINSLTIGTAIQFLNATGVHAEVFSSLAQDVRLRMDTAQINSVVSFNVTNISLAVSRFFCALIGPAVM